MKTTRKHHYKALLVEVVIWPDGVMVVVVVTDLALAFALALAAALAASF